ncbi:aminotransferase class V-fold PLP-dependent enzyme [Raoultibacter phocaeensis]|uniref:aminotransferase class V-fold PLP-dependent enzyme n=1 Tax=Raoultibacter phocaeensis TaxID=2479841 RepID=UPI0015D591F9|nr:aminotransferase class V-fold PLP-dependent enzyme [Raoultibacter phocaeensis]
MDETCRIGIVVLAAGASSRMGDQKLLLELGGKSLVRRAALTALAARFEHVCVVVGSDKVRIAEEVADLPVCIIENDAWDRGQATSVRAGIQSMQGLDAAIVMVADQPFVTPKHLRALADAYRVGDAALFASAHAGKRGNPVLFDASVFGDLEALEGDQGARQLFGRYRVVDVEQGGAVLFGDVDDRDAYEHAQALWVREKGSKRLFPLLGCDGDESGLAYLDSAATAQAPQRVLDAVKRFETEARSNIHRGIYPLAERASDCYEEARERVARFFGIPEQEAIFTHGATEALNLAAFGWAGANLKAGDLVLVDTAGHHANIVPWQMLAREKGIELAYIGLDERGLVDRASWHALLERKPKAAALTQVSNVTGLANDIPLLSREAHEAGAAVVADCAQAAGHMPLQFTALGADFAAVSAHKMYGSFGIGLLWAASERVQHMRPLMGGGGMIERVDTKGFTCTEAPLCFEAGTPNIAGAVGFAEACDFLDDIGLAAIEERGSGLCDRLLTGLQAIGGVRVAGGFELGGRSSIVSFSLDGVHPHDVAQVLADRGVAVRAGNHCAMPLHQALGIAASVRASFGVYSEEGDVDRLLAGIEQAKEAFCSGYR